MTHGSNAGIKRNRRPAGETTVYRRAQLSAEAAAAFDEARGQLSMGLYLELLARNGLPALAPELDLPGASTIQREAHTAAA